MIQITSSGKIMELESIRYLLPYVACIFAFLFISLLLVVADRTPSLRVELPDGPSAGGVRHKSTPLYNEAEHSKPGFISCVDPSTGGFIGHVPDFTRDQVTTVIGKARQAQQIWSKSSFSQRRLLMRILNKHILDSARPICEMASRDSGKALVDAAFGELMVTCEKAVWLANNGERYLRRERRAPGRMMFYKSCFVEYVPLGVVGTIVPWNYPFHNIFNPLLAAVFAGNAIVIKASEHASASVAYYQAIIDAALAAAGAPRGLVSVITGRAETGRALVSGGCDKLVFIGSTAVGRAVMRDAANYLTPLTLELGGKDPFVVLSDASVNEVVPTAMRAAFQSCGQNCVAAERFLVHKSLYASFVEQCSAIAASLRQGPPLGDMTVDCGAMCLPGLREKVHALVEDARSRGARVLVGGQIPNGPGQFYPPTVIADVTPDMKVFQEETFGPVMSISSFSNDEEAVRLANDTVFGLGSYVFSKSQAHANEVGKRIRAGMFVVNDYASNSMCQSLPFGGIKESGFDRFGGIEGLRGMCSIRVHVEDRAPWLMKTAIPAPLQFPVASCGFVFVHSLCKLFYGDVGMKLAAVVALCKLTFLPPSKKNT